LNQLNYNHKLIKDRFYNIPYSFKQRDFIMDKLNKIYFSPVLLAVCFIQPLQALQIIKGPYLQNVSKNAITIMWETDAASDSKVDYGSDAGYGQTATSSEQVTIHEVRLTGLTVETGYHYRVSSGNVSSGDITFKTAPNDNTPFRFSVYGDSRNPSSTGATRFPLLLPHILASDPDIMLTLGDLVRSGGTYSDWQNQFFNHHQPPGIINSFPIPVILVKMKAIIHLITAIPILSF
jgi:hypothetical protein